MKTRLWIFVAVLFTLVGCESGSQVTAPEASFSKSKPSKKCASNDYAFYGLLTWYPVLVDTTVTPPDTLATYDAGYIVAAARECDALYLANNYGGMMVFDLSSPAKTVPIASFENERKFSSLRIRGANLYASWAICTDDGYFAYCTYGTARWNIANPLAPRLTSLVVTGSNF